MTEMQSLAVMLAIDIAMAVAGLFALRDIRRESRESANAARESQELISATLEVARQILREARR